LKQIPTLYEPAIKRSAEIMSFIALALGMVIDHHYTQIGQPNTLQGKVNNQLIDPQRTPCQNFVNQALWQHVRAYFGMLELAPPPPDPNPPDPSKVCIMAHERVWS
jgi:hypothetical protein